MPKCSGRNLVRVVQPNLQAVASVQAAQAEVSSMKRLLVALMTACVTMVMEASAADVPMRRVLTCNGPDAKVEVYVPEAVISGRGVENAKLDRPVTGAYSLDLTEAGKGKIIEPVRVFYAKDRKSVIINQYTRKLPPTFVLVAGATVDFDKRFATEEKCGPFNEE